MTGKEKDSMKKIVSAVLILSLVFSLFTIASAEEIITITIDGEVLEPKDANGNTVRPFLQNGSTYLPVRALSNAFNLKIEWDEPSQSIFIGEMAEPEMQEDDDNKIKIYINGEKFEPKDANGNPVEPVIKDGTTYLPVRAISEAFDKKVDWVDETKTVVITSKKTEVAKSDPLAGKYYYIINKSNGKALAPESYGKDNNVKITLMDKADEDGQLWRVSAVTDGAYIISNKLTGKCIDIPAFSKEEGKVLAQYSINGGKNQQWELIQGEDGYYSILSRLTGFSIEIKDNVLVQTKAAGADTQKWELIYADDTVVKKVLESEGYKTLPEQLKRGYNAYILGKASFSQIVAEEAERLFISNEFEKQNASRQRELITESLSLTAYEQVSGDILNNVPANYKITGVTVEDNYDIWRGSRTKVWITHVEMDGDIAGQVHKFQVVSNEENTPVVEDAIQAIGLFPYAFRHYVRRILWKAGDTANNYNGGGDSIWIRLNYTPPKSQISQVFAHELGHILDTNTLPTPEVWTWAIAQDAVAISSYGSSNQSEDLAEYSRLYWLTLGREAHDELEKVYPARTKVFKGLLYRADNEYFKDFKSFSDQIDEMVNQIKTFGSDSHASRIDITKYYKIVDKATGKVMGIKDGKVENNAEVLLQNYDKNNDSQVFFIERYGSFIKIINKKSGNPIQLNTSYLCGKPLVQYGGEWAVDDKFIPYEKDGGFILINRRSKLGVAAYDGAARSYVEPTVWELVPVGEAAKATYYKIHINNKVLASLDGKLVLADEKDTEDQQWLVKEMEDGYVIISNRATGLVLDVTGASVDPGKEVILYEANKGDNQLFKLNETGNGTTIKAKHSGLFITAGDNGLTQENQSNTGNQLFIFKEIK